jgi:hypothetical protein
VETNNDSIAKKERVAEAKKNENIKTFPLSLRAKKREIKLFILLLFIF